MIFGTPEANRGSSHGRWTTARPSLGRAIARLEDDLGVPLFDRVDAGCGSAPGSSAASTGHCANSTTAAGLDHGNVAIAAEPPLTVTGLITDGRTPGVDIRLHQSDAATMARQPHTGEGEPFVTTRPG